MKMPNKRDFRIGILAMVLMLVIAVNAFAITITISRSYRVGSDSIREGTINFDSSYTPNSGEAVTAANFNLQSIRWMDIRPMKDTSGNLTIFEYKDISRIIRVWETSPTVKEMSGNLSGITGVKFRVYGY